MKKFINSKLSKYRTFDIAVIYCTIAFSSLTLLLVFSSGFLSSASLSAVLTIIVFISLLYYSKKYYDHNGIVANVEKLSLTLLYVAFFEILCEYLGRNMFSLFFISMPLTYAYGGRITGILALIIISAIELNLAREINTFYKLIPLVIATVVFGSFIRGEKYVEGRIKKQVSKLLGSNASNKVSSEDVTTKDQIQVLIKKDLKNLGEFLPHNSIVLYLKNEEGLYEICEFISKDKELIDSSQKLNFRTGYIGWTVKTKTPFMIGNIKNPSENITYYIQEIKIQSLLIIPLTDNTVHPSEKEHDLPNGILIIDSRENDAFSKQHKLLASIIADRINSLLKIFNLQNIIYESSEKLNSIYEYIQQIETGMDTDNILKNLYDTLSKSIESDMICISLKKGSQSEIIHVEDMENGIKGMSFSHKQSLIGIVSENNTPLSLSDISDRSKFRDVFSKEIDLGLGMKSIKSSMIFPISLSDDKDETDIFGTVFFGSIRKKEFNEDQKNLAKMLIQQTAKGIKYSINLRNVKELAIKDGLSGLYNQKHFKEMLSISIAKSQRFNEDLSLILMDIDNFKEINDKYGHLAGDKIISEVGKTVQNSLREIDISARYGGDEFAILLEKTAPSGAKIAAEKIARLFADKPVVFNNEKIPVNLSIGIATCPENANSREILIEKADISLYEAKRSGKNLIIHFNEIGELKSNTEEDINLEKDISQND